MRSLLCLAALCRSSVQWSTTNSNRTSSPGSFQHFNTSLELIFAKTVNSPLATRASHIESLFARDRHLAATIARSSLYDPRLALFALALSLAMACAMATIMSGGYL